MAGALRLSVPPEMVAYIRSFHSDNMLASVCVFGQNTGTIQVENGLRQGCVMASVLFNMYFGLLVQHWSVVLAEKQAEAGIVFHSQFDDLFPRSMCHAALSKI